MEIKKGWINNPTVKSETARLHTSIVAEVCKGVFFQMATKTTLFVTTIRGLRGTFSTISEISKADILLSHDLSVESGFKLVFMSIMLFFSSHL